MSKTKEEKCLQGACISRRNLLKTAGIAGASALVAGNMKSPAFAAKGVYPRVKIANLSDIEEGRTIKFDYPLVGRKNVLMDCGCKVEGGIGPNKSIVAYSMFCTHLGCSVELEDESGMLVCECHQTMYDPKASGRVIEGPAPTSLPKIFLEVDDASGDIYAAGVAGLIYGLRNNLLDGEEVQ